MSPARAVAIAAVRPALTRRSDRVLAGLDVIKVAALVACGVLLLLR